MTKASRKQIVQINDLLKEHLTTSGDLCTYHEGWDDKRIAGTISPDLPVASVASVRREIYGNLIYAKGGPSKANHELREAFLEMAVRFNHLCKAISLSRGNAVDAMHLLINMNELRGKFPDKTP